jgi:hypothetical protein
MAATVTFSDNAPTGPGASQLVCEAIRRRRIVVGRYHETERVLEPYCHGMSPRGEQLVMAYQRQPEVGRDLSGWRCFRLAEFEDLAMTDVSFVPLRDDYRARNDAIATMHCSV